MAMNNSNFQNNNAKDSKAVENGSILSAVTQIKRWAADGVNAVSGSARKVHRLLNGKPSKELGRSAAGSTAFRRRPPVRREDRSGVCSHRTDEPQRYHLGIEAAELFELAESERMAICLAAEEERAPERTGFPGFLYRHRKGLIAACLIFAMLFGGVQYLLHMYTKEDVFISDEIEAGNITITDRLTTTDEQSEKVTYFLLLGVDDSSLLTDCIWIMCWDHIANEVNVMQVPRDTYVGPGDSPYPHKINAVYGNPKTVKWCDYCEVSPDESERDNGRHTVCGSKLDSRKESNVSALIRVINQRFGLPIDHFVIFNFRGFAKIIDTMGGVDIHLDYTVKDSAIHLEPGDHHLTGWPAVDFMRSRKGFANGDIGRVSNQRILIDALLKKALDMDLASMLNVVVTCANAQCFQTDLSLAEIKDMAVSARSLSVDRLTMVTMPGIDHWVRPNPSYYVCNEAATAEMINEYLLPYGLPDGSMASTDTINFPEPLDRLSPSVTEDPSSTTTSTTAPTEYEGEQTSAQETTTTNDAGIDITTAPTGEPTSAPTGGETEPTESTTVPTESTTEATTTTTSDGGFVVITTPPSETTTTEATTTTAETTTTTAAATAEPTTTTAAPEGEAVGGSVTTPLSDPRG